MCNDKDTESKNGMRLLEVLTRTRFQVFTYTQGGLAKGDVPQGAGSGFVLRYKDRCFFVTADHVCHPDDYKKGEKKWNCRKKPNSFAQEAL